MELNSRPNKLNPTFSARLNIVAQAKLMEKRDSNILKEVAKKIGTDDDMISISMKNSRRYADSYWAEYGADFRLGHKFYKTKKSKNIRKEKISPFSYAMKVLGKLKSAYIKMQKSS